MHVNDRPWSESFIKGCMTSYPAFHNFDCHLIIGPCNVGMLLWWAGPRSLKRDVRPYSSLDCQVWFQPNKILDGVGPLCLDLTLRPPPTHGHFYFLQLNQFSPTNVKFSPACLFLFCDLENQCNRGCRVMETKEGGLVKETRIQERSWWCTWRLASNSARIYLPL